VAGQTKPGRCAAARALTFVGVRESPPGSNRGKLIDRWNLAAGVPIGSAWCMSFAHAMFLACGVVLGGWASVGNFETWARGHGYEIARPWRGSLLCIRWDADDWPDHVEIVTRVLGLRWRGGRFVGWVSTVGGNTGNAVSKRTRRVEARWRFVSIPA
jgi:hypothetical protein